MWYTNLLLTILVLTGLVLLYKVYRPCSKEQSLKQAFARAEEDSFQWKRVRELDAIHHERWLNASREAEERQIKRCDEELAVLKELLEVAKPIRDYVQ